MTQSDLTLLLEMGFEKARAELALKKSGGLQGALEWLEKTQDKPLEELQNEGKDDVDEEETEAAIKGLEAGDSAKSLVCNECGKKFRNQAMATFHAEKSGHTDFAESTEEIAPLTEEEKKARLEELRQKLAAKRANQALLDKETNLKNEKIRQKSTRESQDAKEELARKEQIKEAAKKRQEKLADAEAKKRIKAKIEADKEERRRKAEQAKAAREGRAVASSSTAPPVPAAAAAPKPSVSHNEARLRLQTSKGNIQKTFPADTTLFEIAQELEAEHGLKVSSLTLTFPRKVYQPGVDFGISLREAGLVPSGILIVQ
ncbi:DNA-binding protein [Pleurostoma richardsiae]|uniref:DNA-binding protein n=1 Tax=Pleurostoma richardsiae TaxID=41990 RepID=A0AA38VKD2_9PEZI|nr:DNA-binding protein [Pleurostoma richardsiae]